MNQRDLIFLILKGLLVWLVLSGFVWYFGEWLVSVLFPLLKAVMRMMMPELAPSLRLVKSAQSQLDYSIELSVSVLRPIYLNTVQNIPKTTNLVLAGNLLHILVPLVIEGTILLVWPVQRWSQRFLLITFGLLSAVLVVLVTLPALLLGNLEISLQDIALTGQNPRSVPWFVDWLVFCEMGGRWLLGIVAAWLCIRLQRELLPSLNLNENSING
jgi:hypothetical protein